VLDNGGEYSSNGASSGAARCVSSFGTDADAARRLHSELDFTIDDNTCEVSGRRSCWA
jgi:hypothetical protein